MPKVDFSLYLITAREQTHERPLVPLLQQSLQVGLRAIQIREKDLSTRDLLSLTREIVAVAHAVEGRVLVNDRVDVAKVSGADGVHLRADSVPVSIARTLLGPSALLGQSAHTVEEVVKAEAEGADFVVFGPIYHTPSKARYGAPLGLSMLEQAASSVSLPVFAIGGITVPLVREVRRAGAFGVAVISSILSSPRIEETTSAFLDELQKPIV